MIHRQFPIWAREQPTSASMSSHATDLERRLRRDYRVFLEAAIAECGHAGTIPWPEPPATIEADEEAVARFVVPFLHPPLQRTYARSSAPDIATVDLWRHVPRWRWRHRQHLLQLAHEIRLSGWQAFDIWLADRIASNLLYPSRLPIPRTLRRPLPEELDPSRKGYGVVCWPDDPARQRRFDRLPRLTLHIFSLNRIYGRSYAEIGRRFGISQNEVRKHMRRAILASFSSRPFAKEIFHDARLGWRLLKRWTWKVRHAHHNQRAVPS